MKTSFSYILPFFFFLLCSAAAYTQTQWIDSVKKVLVTQKADTNKVWALKNLSEAYQQSYPDSGFYFARQALDLAEKLQFDRGIFWSIVYINKSLYILGNYALELDYAFKAYPLGKKLNDPYTIGWANGMIGDCYFNLGEYDSSIRYYREILKTAEQNSIIDLFSLYSALVPVFINLHQPDSALLYAKKGYDLFKGNPLLNKGDDDTKYAKSYQYRFLGEAYAGKEYYDSALFYYHMSIPFSEAIRSEINKIDVFNLLAKLYKEKNNPDSATWYATKVLNEKMINRYPVGFLKAANTLADIYELQNKPDSTLKYLRLALVIKDSLFNRENTIAIQNIFFREQEKQKEIAAAKSALQTEYRTYFLIVLLIALVIVAGIIIRNKRLKQLQNMRNSIADDLHDDIGSTLSSISIMSELAREKSPEALSLLTSIGESASAIQENMSDIVWTINPKNDLLENVLQRMNQFASDILEVKNIELDFKNDGTFPASKLTMDQRRNFYLFFKEVINNAAKYADAKNVSVCITQKDHHLEMNIFDNGKGFDTDKIFNGNGMHTLKKRATELCADFNITSHIDKGTAVKLKFRIT
jgi:two-component system, NarL family, sensor histidine kinase UhpB